MQGLGGNPAVTGLTKQDSIEVGTVVMQRIAQNSKLLSFPTLGLAASGSNKYSEEFNDAPRYAKYTYGIGKDNWFAIKHYYDSTVYPFFNQKLDMNKDLQYSFFKKEATETLSFIYSREISKDLIGGIEIGSNTFTSEKKINYNKDARDFLTVSDVYSFTTSKPYYSLQLGLVKIIDSANKFTFVHKFSDKRGVYTRTTNKSTYSDVEVVPNETSLGYVYTMNKNFEIGAYYKMTWGASYTTNKQGYDDNRNSYSDNQDTITKYPYNNLTLVGDYRVNDKLAFQSYYVYIRNYKKIEISNNETNLDRGWKICQLGGNVQYKVVPDGTILLGAYNTHQLSEDTDINWKIDQMVTYVSLAYDL